MESTTDVGSHLSGSESKKLDDGMPISMGQKAPVTAAVITAVVLSVMHSFNFGIAIGTPGNTELLMEKVRIYHPFAPFNYYTSKGSSNSRACAVKFLRMF